MPLTVATGTPEWDSVTAARAGYVKMMLSNVMGTQALGGGGLDDVVLGYGGGYVLSVSSSGTPYSGSEQHTAEVVLGVNRVVDRMQGETYLGPAAIECYRPGVRPRSRPATAPAASGRWHVTAQARLGWLSAGLPWLARCPSGRGTSWTCTST